MYVSLSLSLSSYVYLSLTGDITAIAKLSPEQISKIRQTLKGDIIVPVQIFDSHGNEPAVAEMCWAWVR